MNEEKIYPSIAVLLVLLVLFVFGLVLYFTLEPADMSQPNDAVIVDKFINSQDVFTVMISLQNGDVRHLVVDATYYYNHEIGETIEVCNFTGRRTKKDYGWNFCTDEAGLIAIQN